MTTKEDTDLELIAHLDFEPYEGCESRHENSTCSGKPVARLVCACCSTSQRVCLNAVKFVLTRLAISPKGVCAYCRQAGRGEFPIAEHWSIEPL